MWFCADSQDKLQENQIVTSLTNPQGVDISGAVALNSCNPGGGLRISQSVSSLEGVRRRYSLQTHLCTPRINLMLFVICYRFVQNGWAGLCSTV